MTPTQAEAQVKALAALDHIQNAQLSISRACQELSSITNGGSVAYARLQKLYDRIHAEWYRVKRAAERGEGKWDLDGFAAARLEKEPTAP